MGLRRHSFPHFPSLPPFANTLRLTCTDLRPPPVVFSRPAVKLRVRLEQRTGGTINPNDRACADGGIFSDCTQDLKIEPTRRCFFEPDPNPRPSDSGQLSDLVEEGVEGVQTNFAAASAAAAAAAAKPLEEQILVRRIMAKRSKAVLHADRARLLLTSTPQEEVRRGGRADASGRERTRV